MRSSGQGWLLDGRVTAVGIHPLHAFGERSDARVATGLDVADLDSLFAAPQAPTSDQERAVQPGHRRTSNDGRAVCDLPPS
jgi:hypothetical protein